MVALAVLHSSPASAASPSLAAPDASIPERFLPEPTPTTSQNPRAEA
jgi:hypothetical protein